MFIISIKYSAINRFKCHAGIRGVWKHDGVAVILFTVYCKSFKVEKFRRSIVKRKTFTVKHFRLVLANIDSIFSVSSYMVLKMAGHGPGPSLKEFL